MSMSETMREFIIPGSERVIRGKLLHGYPGLKKVILSAGVKTIRESAFSTCPSLECADVHYRRHDPGSGGRYTWEHTPW